MSDLLRIRAEEDAASGLKFSWVDEQMVGSRIVFDQEPTVTIKDGDIWQVEVVDVEPPKSRAKGAKKIVTVRLIAKVQALQAWQSIKELPNFWIDPTDLQCMLSLLHAGRDIMLVGAKGTGKTSFPTALARALGWQEPCKVDVPTVKRASDWFGTEAASSGSTHFVRSELYDVIIRARIAEKQGLDTHFVVIIDEANRVHQMVNNSLHGLFDDTRQVTITTTEGSQVIRLPKNLHFIGTMNVGAEYTGTHDLEDALKDRFAPFKMRPMPFGVEVDRLVAETGIMKTQAEAVVTVAQRLRDAAANGHIGYSPSYRACRNAGIIIRDGIKDERYNKGGGERGRVVLLAIMKALMGWYEGVFNEKGEPENANSELGKAFSALRLAGVSVQDVAGKVA